MSKLAVKTGKKTKFISIPHINNVLFYSTLLKKMSVKKGKSAKFDSSSKLYPFFNEWFIFEWIQAVPYFHRDFPIKSVKLVW